MVNSNKNFVWISLTHDIDDEANGYTKEVQDLYHEATSQYKEKAKMKSNISPRWGGLKMEEGACSTMDYWLILSLIHHRFDEPNFTNIPSHLQLIRGTLIILPSLQKDPHEPVLQSRKRISLEIQDSFGALPLSLKNLLRLRTMLRRIIPML
jgi:hypothetical protein